ncbi:hypothetical protein GPS60_05495 [Acinetobacter haemolyticus]|uniref:O-antigen ligase family protein n=1 Tax=Acinetobacter haemolyticus TaxID=29430 RepID=UPI00137235E3|nr:O-antigen ligase family protein [Acinetobacter haemolyticus]NAR47102.1 hypothetical protein [Acinetobacter haemolyticus]
MKIENYIKYTIVLLLILSWLYPFHYYPWIVAENEFFILLLSMIMSFLLFKYKYVKVNEFIFFPIVILILSFFQYLIIESYYLEDLVVISIYMLFIALMLLLGEVFLTGVNIGFILKVIILLCFLNSIIMFLQYFNVNNMFVLEHSGMKRFYGNIGQPNHISTLFLMGVVSLLILYKRKKISFLSLYILSIYLTFFIFLTGSRAGLLTFFILIMIGSILQNNRKFDTLFFGSLILIYMFFSYSFSVNSRNNLKVIESSVSDSRLILWKDSISSVIENPWLGYGVNGVRTSRLFSSLNFKVSYVSSHNIFIDFFLWFGVIGGLLCIIYGLYLFIKIYKDRKNCYGILLFLTPFIVHSLLEYPFRYLYFLILTIPIFSLVRGVKIMYIKRSVVIFFLFVYFLLISFVFIDFNRFSRSAFFAQIQKCESIEGNPIVLDLMSNYAQLYCGSLTSSEMRKVIYHYPYPVHVKYYLDLGYYDENLDKFQKKIKSYK